MPRKTSALRPVTGRMNKDAKTKYNMWQGIEAGFDELCALIDYGYIEPDVAKDALISFVRRHRAILNINFADDKFKIRKDIAAWIGNELARESGCPELFEQCVLLNVPSHHRDTWVSPEGNRIVLN